MARLSSQVLFAGSFSALVVGLVDRGRVASTGKQQLQSKPLVSPVAGCRGIDCVKQYVALHDAHFTWYDTHHQLSGHDESSGVRWTGYVLNVTSQHWVTSDAAGFPLWWHMLVVVVPANLEVHDWATLHVEFGKNTMAGLRHFSNRDPSGGTVVISNDTLEARLPDIKEAIWSSVQMATATRAAAASLFLALNQYQTFADDPWHEKRMGDDLKAFTWFDFLFGGATEPERIMELPVAKAVVRAMDTVTAFTAMLPSGQVTQFGVYGHSKFGAATWMMGAIDSRVKAIAPTALIFGEDSMVVHGGNPALLKQPKNPYDGLIYWNGTEQLTRLMEIVSPLNWLHHVSVPKLVIMDTNDVWMDSAIRDVGTWWPHLPEPKGLLFAEAEHDTVSILTMPMSTSFFRGVILNVPMPSIDYTFDVPSGQVRVLQRSAHTATSVHLHFAMSCMGPYPEPRFLHSDWSKELVWHAGDGAAHGRAGQWGVDLYNPELAVSLMGRGFNSSGVCSRGAFVEVRYEWPQTGWPFVLTTPVLVVPLEGSKSKP